ncbi:MAG: hypothetical protein GX748_03125, partial [Lentisphaerae bacterium]|nr:hypothetical protein [Lentisphaerota bacterium]
MRRWILAMMVAAGAARAWTPGGDYPTGDSGLPAATFDPLSGLVPYSMNIQVVGRISTNDVAIFTDRTGRYVRGTNLFASVLMPFVAHTNDFDNPHQVTAAQVGALTTETDEIALQAVFTHTNNEAIHLSTEQATRIANA